MDAVATLALISYPALLGLLAFFMKRWIDRLEKIIEKMVDTQNVCQVTLAKTYRTKSEAEADSSRQWLKIDDHGNRLTRVETLLEDGK
jgi:hypothetical protein